MLVDEDETRFVPEELANGDGMLAVLRELGPVPRDRRVVVEPPACVGNGERHRREPLGRRKDDDHRVLVPRVVAFRRAATAPQVDDLLAAPIGSDGRTYFAALAEVARELRPHFFEAGRNSTAHLDGGSEAANAADRVRSP
jgi:hypothetical protein